MNSDAVPSGTDGDCSLTWREFETIVGLVFRHQGYEVKVTSARTDGAVDLELYKGDHVTLVQCKHWNDRDVDVDVVRSLGELVEAQGAAAGYIVTSSSFTEDAWAEFNQQNKITLVDGLALRMLVAVALNSDLEVLTLVGKTAPPCPVCRQSMVEEVSNRSHDLGGTFWSCAMDECDGRRSVRKDISWASTV